MDKREPPSARDAADSESESAGASTIKSISMTLRILDALAAAGEPVRITELANQLGEPKAKIHRHLTTLRSFGVVEQTRASERYRLGWKLYQLGQAALEQFDLKRIAEPHAVALRDKVRMTVVLGVPVGGEALVIANYEYASGLVISSVPGSIAPATASAQGRIMLAYASQAQQNKILAQSFPRFTPNTLCDRPTIEKRLKAITERFYDYAAEEVLLGVNTLAAPIFDADNKLVGSVAILASIQYIPNPPHPDLIAAVQECAASISLEFGSHAYRGVAAAFRRG